MPPTTPDFWCQADPFYHGSLVLPAVKRCNDCPWTPAAAPQRFWRDDRGGAADIAGVIPHSAPVAVRLRQITRRFGSVLAVDRLDLDVPVGSCFALLGSNGAGKSTTVRILSTLLAADQGEAEIAGLDVRRNPHAVRRAIGVVPDFPVLFDPLTPRENLQQIATIRGLPKPESERRIVELAAVLSLEPHLDEPVIGLSHGTKKKTALAVAMLHAPHVLLLDEPFEGIDPLATGTIRDLLATLRARGVTVFLTSHVLPLVETMATHVAVMERGTLRAVGTLDHVAGPHGSLEAAFVALVGGTPADVELSWYSL